MGKNILRIIFIVFLSFLGLYFGKFGILKPLFGFILGLLVAIIIIILEIFMHRISLRGFIAFVIGLVLGLVIAKIFLSILELLPFNEKFSSLLQIFLYVVFSYLGIMIALKSKEEFSLIIPYIKFSPHSQKEEIIILDTSVIIDGRIADIFQTRFVEGKIVVPRFVLKELQLIADSQDHLKRTRGRRGLDVLNRIKKIPHIEVRIHEEDYPEIAEVDAKLVKLAKSLEAKIL
ncbi:MAG: PIN/TRAM domain-containing protein, partial [Candidatus Omnitrophica bacterium]|nr:PIN/TRAM domain-containing protein [Candidatus Omnitrophota bacterium]